MLQVVGGIKKPDAGFKDWQDLQDLQDWHDRARRSNISS